MSCAVYDVNTHSFLLWFSIGGRCFSLVHARIHYTPQHEPSNERRTQSFGIAYYRRVFVCLFFKEKRQKFHFKKNKISCDARVHCTLYREHTPTHSRTHTNASFLKMHSTSTCRYQTQFRFHQERATHCCYINIDRGVANRVEYDIPFVWIGFGRLVGWKHPLFAYEHTNCTVWISHWHFVLHWHKYRVSVRRTYSYMRTPHMTVLHNILSIQVMGRIKETRNTQRSNRWDCCSAPFFNRTPLLLLLFSVRKQHTAHQKTILFVSKWLRAHRFPSIPSFALFSLRFFFILFFCVCRFSGKFDGLTISKTG